MCALYLWFCNNLFVFFPFAEDGQYFLKVLIPSYAAGSIIGKGGQTIVQLQKETGATIKLSKSKDFYPGKRKLLRRGHWLDGATVAPKIIGRCKIKDMFSSCWFGQTEKCTVLTFRPHCQWIYALVFWSGFSSMCIFALVIPAPTSPLAAKLIWKDCVCLNVHL